MGDRIRIAAVQMDSRLMAKRVNLDRILVEARRAAARKAQLIAFPECALTGYVYTSREEALPYAEPVPGPATDEMAKCCRETGIFMVAGLLERDDDRCFNAAVLVGPEGFIGRYRKIHLPFLGVDRFLDRGDEPFRVYPTSIGNIGMHICYDCNFPESARVMTLLGADILVLPTNWPEGRDKVPKFLVPARAFENRVHVVAVDRAGTERGANFIGLSRIVDTFGDVVAEAGSGEETIYADIDPSDALQKRIVIKAGEFEIDPIHDRRPEFYREITRERGSRRD